MSESAPAAEPVVPAEPDVTVVVAVYNTMPYLTECLNSLVEQSIGLDRLEVVAVDDGSTDDSPKELARFAAAHPGVFRVITQENSGGPAAPSNRALDVATGRYVFFLGSDDYLGPEALERMVAAADEHGTDVVVAKMVGVNGRWVPQAVFERTRHDATLRNSPLPWALSNTKLFRRALIEKHHLRYPEDLPILSDQPFTLEACFRAEGISILDDYDYYFAVRRGDEGNVTYRGSLEHRLTGTERIMRLTERFTETEDERYGLNRRHLTSELSFVLGYRLLAAEPDVRERIMAGARPLLTDFATDALLGRLPLTDRIHLTLARSGAFDLLLSTLRFEAEHGGAEQVDEKKLPLTVVEGRAHLGYPFVGDPRFADLTGLVDRTQAAVRGLGKARASFVTDAAGPALLLTAETPVPGYGGLVRSASLGCERKPAGGVPTGLDCQVGYAPADGGTRLSTRVPLAPLLAAASAAGRTAWSLRWRLDTADGELPVPVATAPGTTGGPASVRLRRGLHVFRASATVESDGALTFVLTPIRLRRVIAQRLRRLRATGRK
ncbi:glycosyltransferase family 2 protein [Streptomyces sp. NPDC048410]|uniref:glycosyltransferase family 2 protein n=1 Tax=Streptomyces sp. NPDC048410 TaxID=3365545 RepID=UPI00371DFFB3